MGALLYDPDCGFCTRAAGWLGRFGVTCEIAAGYPATLAALSVDPARAGREIPFVHDDGTVTWGAAAIADALATGRPAARLASFALGAPGLRRLARAAYRLVANNRHRLPGG